MARLVVLAGSAVAGYFVWKRVVEPELLRRKLSAEMEKAAAEYQSANGGSMEDALMAVGQSACMAAAAKYKVDPAMAGPACQIASFALVKGGKYIGRLGVKGVKAAASAVKDAAQEIGGGVKTVAKGIGGGVKTAAKGVAKAASVVASGTAKGVTKAVDTVVVNPAQAAYTIGKEGIVRPVTDIATATGSVLKSTLVNPFRDVGKAVTQLPRNPVGAAKTLAKGLTVKPVKAVAVNTKKIAKAVTVKPVKALAKGVKKLKFWGLSGLGALEAPELVRLRTYVTSRKRRTRA